MSILDWPNQDQPRYKLLNQGAAALTDAELIAIFLQTGARGKTALDLARDLLQLHGGLKKLTVASKQILLMQPGIGLAKYAALKAALELGRRAQQISLSPGQTLSSSNLTRDFIRQRLEHYDREVFACLFLDTHLRLIEFADLFHGTINHANIYPREIVKRALALNAVKIILAHNHPSGIVTPSSSDQEVTQLIVKALALIEVEVIDHLVVGGGNVYSFAENGLLDGGRSW